MKKTVLFLINGFGIEKKDSYSVYDEKALPTLDRMMKECLYTSIPSQASNYTTGYQLFSTGTINTNNYSYLNHQIEDNKLIDNPNLKQFNSDNIGKETRIHIFMQLSNTEDIEAINKFVKYLKIDINRVMLHFILKQNSLTEYKNITNLINNVTYSSFKSSNIGMIFGENCILDDSLNEHLRTIERVFYNSKSGEKWVEYTKKFNILANSNVLPVNIPPFCVNDDFSLQNDENFIFFNFGKCPYEKLIKGLKNPQIVYKTTDSNTLKFYSLFPMETETQIPNLLENVRASEYLSQYLEQTNINAAILTDRENLNIINYMVNGFANITPPRIKYLLNNKELLENKEQMNLIVNSKDYDLVIINTRIDHLNTINEIKSELHEIDNYIKIMEEICADNATLIVSSLFGINKELQISNLASERATVNFYGSVPVIVANKNYNKEDYSLGYGNLINVLATAIDCTNEKAKYPSLIRKKSAFLKKIQETMGKKKLIK